MKPTTKLYTNHRKRGVTSGMKLADVPTLGGSLKMQWEKRAAAWISEGLMPGADWDNRYFREKVERPGWGLRFNLSVLVIPVRDNPDQFYTISYYG